MKIYDPAARKRPVNLTLNEDLVDQTGKITGNLSGVVESLLADHLARERQRHAAQAEVARATVSTWTNFAENHGSFADEHSTL